MVEKWVRHGDHGSPLYKKWAAMIARCNHDVKYKERGVDIEWRDYKNFRKDLEKSFNFHVNLHGLDNTTLDRIDNKKGYSKKNCRWATKRVQRLNGPTCNWIKWEGKQVTLYDLSVFTKISYTTLCSRFKKMKSKVNVKELVKPVDKRYRPDIYKTN